MAKHEEDEEEIPQGAGKVRKTKTLLQMEAVECGAAALGIILRYFGYYATLEEMRIECGVSRDGSKASKVVKAARRFGLKARGLRRDPEDLHYMQMPCILFWNFNHFLVLEGFKGDKVYLNDPASGRRTVSHEELDEAFTGVVLEFEKTDDFVPGGQKPSLLKALISRLRHSERALAYVTFAGLFLVIPGLVIPTFTQIFVDEILVQQMTGWLRPLLLGMGIAAVIVAVLNLLQRHFLLRLQTKMALSTSSKFFAHILRLPVEFFAQRSGGDIAHRVGINDDVARIVAGDLAKAFLDVFVAVFFLFLMFQYDALLTVMAVSIALLNIGAFKYFSELRTDSNRRLLQEEGKQSGTATAGLRMIETLKATGTESEFFARWAGHQAKTTRADQELGVLTVKLTTVPLFLGLFNGTAIIGLGGLRVMSGELTIGELIAFQMLMGNFLRPVQTFVQLGNKVQEAEGSMNRLDDVLRYKQDPYVHAAPTETTEEAAPKVKLNGLIEIRDLTFGYSKLEPALIEDFNLTIRPGERVALVGGSGSGKSTIARLVAGLYEPWSGEIAFDGQPRAKLPRGLICNSLGYVDQEIFLFEGTIRDNLSMWDTTIPEAHLTAAAKDAAVHSLITARPGAYAAKLDEGGNNFSGGQCQRLEIARALVGKPSILILDEATSALDVTTEKLIDDNLRRRGCTCLIIAHRLSTVRDCDEIIVMHYGKVVQRGTHEEMIDVDGPYRELMQAH